MMVMMSIIQNSGKMRILRIRPKMLPRCARVMIPQIKLVMGMIAKIMLTR